MEDLLRSLRNLGLKAPEPSQLSELLDEDEKVQQDLARIISLSSVVHDLEEGGDGSSAGAAALMGQDLLQEAVSALLDNFRRSLKRQQQAAERERKGQSKRVKWPPRKALLARHQAALQKLHREQEESPSYRPRLVFDGLDSYHSTLPLDKLEVMAGADLVEAPKRYEGRYLLCRVITPLLLYAGVTFIVEDPSGAALPVSVSHFTSNLNLTTEQVSSMLPIGIVIAIREPFLSLDHQSRAGPCTGKADPGIRIDSPTDIVCYKGSIVFKEDLHGENQAVSDWLRISEPATITDNVALESTIERLVKARRYGQAARVLNRAKGNGLHIPQSQEAEILYRVDAWEEAENLFQQAEPHAGRNVDKTDEQAGADFSLDIAKLTARQARLRCETRMQQQVSGPDETAVESIYFSAADSVPHLDTSDFIGPLAVKSIPGAGRGLVTTRAVKAGELLLLCKALCPAYPDDEECRGSPLLRLNLENGVVSTTSQVRAQTKLIHAIVDRPELALPILGLTAGPHMKDSTYVGREYPVRTAFESSTFEGSPRPDVDAAYVDGVLRFNAFGPAQAPSRKGPQSAGELEKSTMPHPLPAILNHACLPNVSSVFLSNIVTTRALADLPAGCEIVHQYVRGEEALAIRTANLSKHGFECACKLCVLDRRDGLDNCQLRARIIQGESKAILDRSFLLLRNSSRFVGEGDGSKEDEEAHEDVIESLEHLIARIDATYSTTDRSAFRPDLFVAIDARTRHLARKDVDKALESAKDALSCVGATVDLANEQRPLGELPRLHFDPSVALMLFLATLLAMRGRDRASLAWTGCAFRAHESMIGGGRRVFLDRWGIEDYRPALDLQWPPSS